MPLSKEEFDEACRCICPQCAKGLLAERRGDTGEFCHNAITNPPGAKGTSVIAHSLCWANGLRLSRFNPNTKA
jgi:hypothetical protein